MELVIWKINKMDKATQRNLEKQQDKQTKKLIMNKCESPSYQENYS